MITAILALLAFALMACVCGCSSTQPAAQPDPHAAYRAALARTAPADTEAAPLTPEQERAALARFNEFYSVYSVESIKAGVRGVYAENAYFGDPFDSVSGIDEIEEYFVRMAEPVKTCTFDVEAVDRAGAEYWIRWTMNLEVNAAKGKPFSALGVSHVRFDDEGKVLFQQDYWDSSALLDRLPVVGFFTRKVKKRLE